MELYKLNRLYFEAKEFLEKYGYANIPAEFGVHFVISSDPKGAPPKLECIITHMPEDPKNNPELEFHSVGSTPVSALAKFEERLIAASGKNPHLENSGVQLAGDTKKEENE